MKYLFIVAFPIQFLFTSRNRHCDGWIGAVCASHLVPIHIKRMRSNLFAALHLSEREKWNCDEEKVNSRKKQKKEEIECEYFAAKLCRSASPALCNSMVDTTHSNSIELDFLWPKNKSKNWTEQRNEKRNGHTLIRNGVTVSRHLTRSQMMSLLMIILWVALATKWGFQS